MDRSDVITLIAETFTADDLGQEIAQEITREVFCNVASISRAEWYEAGRDNLKPEYKITMFAPEYNGERIAEYNGARYGVFRTYLAKNETIELYLESKAGV